MCSGTLEANRTRIQPVLKLFRHFAHFVSRYWTEGQCCVVCRSKHTATPPVLLRPELKGVTLLKLSQEQWKNLRDANKLE